MVLENLTAQLFKEKFDYPETSTLVQRIANQGGNLNALDKERDYAWYRIITPELWNWRGLPEKEIDEVLSRISTSIKPRSNETWRDTVIGYQPGNWIYEFLEQSAIWQAEAESLDKGNLDDETRQKLHYCYLTASQYSSIASYPHYRNDKMASYAQTRGFKFYQQAMQYAPYVTEEIELANGTVKGWLHLPRSSNEKDNDFNQYQAFPTVLICSGLGNLQIDFYRYFNDCLAPQGIAMLTLDVPSVGHSKHYNLTQNSSNLYQAVIESLPPVPWIDHNRLFLAGFRFGAHIAMRLAYLMPTKITGVVNFKPIFHQAFVDEKTQQYLPTMYKDMLASRIGMTMVSNSLLAAELQYYSLKRQGILNKACNIPVLSISVENDKLSNQREVKLIQSTKVHKILRFPRKPLQSSLQARLMESAHWMRSIL